MEHRIRSSPAPSKGSLSTQQRPALTRALNGAELQRWYWLKSELMNLAKELGVSTAGGKKTLEARIAAALDGTPFEEPSSRSAQLTGALTGPTLIPRGQRCSQVVRAWFIEQVGSQFRFDAPMREFFANNDGTRTMQDALDHYRETRSQRPKEIEAQFEYNRFTRAWHAKNPTGSREELLSAWRNYRSHPIDERGRI